MCHARRPSPPLPRTRRCPMDIGGRANTGPSPFRIVGSVDHRDRDFSRPKIILRHASRAIVNPALTVPPEQ